MHFRSVANSILAHRSSFRNLLSAYQVFASIVLHDESESVRVVVPDEDHSCGYRFTAWSCLGFRGRRSCTSGFHIHGHRFIGTWHRNIRSCSRSRWPWLMLQVAVEGITHNPGCRLAGSKPAGIEACRGRRSKSAGNRSWRLFGSVGETARKSVRKAVSEPFTQRFGTFRNDKPL